MRALLFDDARAVQITEVADPVLRPGFVLLRNRASGICGSDLHVYRGHWPLDTTYPTGHEFCADVIGVGEGVTNVELGQRVCVECFSHCGSCAPCRTGQHNLCMQRRFLSSDGPGGFAPVALVHASTLLPIPPELSDEDGAFVEPLAVGVRALAQSGARAPDRLGIIGAGTIGLCTAAVAQATGFAEVWLSCRYPHQVEAARRLGVAQPVLAASDRGSGPFREAVERGTDGRGVDAVVDTIGTAGSFEDAATVVRPGGSISLVGGYTEPVTVPLASVVGKELQLAGSCCYAYSDGRRDFQTAIGLLAAGQVSSELFVTHRFALDDAPEAFGVADDKQSASIKVQFILT